MNEVNAHRARLQLGWVTVFRLRSTQPCIPPGSLNRVPASAGVKAGMSPLPLCDPIWHVSSRSGEAGVLRT